MQRQQTLDLGDYLNNNFSGVNVSESADKSVPDGHLLSRVHGLATAWHAPKVFRSTSTASASTSLSGTPLTGTSYPNRAIANVTLHVGIESGLRPQHARRCSVGTNEKRPRESGTELEAYGGSFGRRAFEGETGGAAGPFDYFFTGDYFDETGWRDLSPTASVSGVRQGRLAERQD